MEHIYLNISDLFMLKRLCYLNLLVSSVLSGNTINILGRIILCCRGCPVYCVFSSMAYFYPQSASNTPWIVTMKNVSRHCQMIPQPSILTLQWDSPDFELDIVVTSLLPHKLYLSLSCFNYTMGIIIFWLLRRLNDKVYLIHIYIVLCACTFQLFINLT